MNGPRHLAAIPDDRGGAVLVRVKQRKNDLILDLRRVCRDRRGNLISLSRPLQLRSDDRRALHAAIGRAVGLLPR